MQLVAGTVYKSFNQFAKENDIKTEDGTLVVKGGTINLFTDNEEAEPGSTATMAPDQSSPLSIGTHPLDAIVRWFAFTVASGAPVVTETFAVGR